MKLPIRNVQFAKFHYLAFLGLGLYFTTRAGLIDFKKWYGVATIRRI